jgi:hypothetical protein
MAFSDTVFPDPKLIHGIRKSISDPVSVVGNGTFEYRIKKTQFERYSWNLPTQNMLESTKETIRSFLAQRSHGLDSFKFIDPAHSVLTDNILSHKSGSKWYLNLAYDSSTPGTHPIFHPAKTGSPENADLTVSVNGGSPLGTITAFAIEDGKPVITVAGTSGGETVRVSGTYYMAVRLDSSLGWALAALDHANPTTSYPDPNVVAADEIRLVEVFEY